MYVGLREVNVPPITLTLLCQLAQVRFHRFALSKNVLLLGRRVDKAEWPLTFPPSTVNAFYVYSRNQVWQ